MPRSGKNTVRGLVAAVAAAVAGLTAGLVAASPASASPTATSGTALALTPPMGWNDWAHFQCGYTESTILANARALVSTGLAAKGCDTVTTDDCWMQTGRDASDGSAGQQWTYQQSGNLVNPHSGDCLDVYGGGSANGTKLDIWPCGANQANQTWSLPQ